MVSIVSVVAEERVTIATRASRVPPRCRRSPSAPATGAPEETSADTRVIGLFEGESLPDGPLRALSDSGEASGKPRKLAVTHADGARA